MSRELKLKFKNNGMVIPDAYQDFDSAAVFAPAMIKAEDVSSIDNFINGVDGNPPIFGIIVTTGENGSVSHDQENDYATQGTLVTVTATPDELHQFDKWIGPVSDIYNPVITIDLQENTYLKATFRLQT